VTAAEFVKTLSVKQREGLNGLLRNPVAMRDISVLLGVKKEHVDEHAQHCLALAKSGRTIELFKENL
jgi:hypothetical protein